MAVDLQARLADAEEAYHQLMVGRSVVELRDQNGETIRYSLANASRLLGYIYTLRAQLGLPTTGLGPAGVIIQ